MPLPFSSLVAIQDQLLVAKNNNTLVPPSPPLSPPVLFQVSWSTEGPRVHNLLKLDFRVVSRPTVLLLPERLQRRVVPATCDEDSWLSRPVSVPSTRQPVHIASTTFFRWKPWMAMTAKEGCDKMTISLYFRLRRGGKVFCDKSLVERWLVGDLVVVVRWPPSVASFPSSSSWLPNSPQVKPVDNLSISHSSSLPLSSCLPCCVSTATVLVLSPMSKVTEKQPWSKRELTRRLL